MASSARTAAICPGIISTSSSDTMCRRSAAARSPMIGMIAVAIAVHSARTSSSEGPSETHAAARPAPPSASHELASSVFPQPAGAAISVQQDSRPAVNRACSQRRDTRCVASGTANLTSQSAALAVGPRPPPFLILCA